MAHLMIIAGCLLFVGGIVMLIQFGVSILTICIALAMILMSIVIFNRVI